MRNDRNTKRAAQKNTTYHYDSKNFALHTPYPIAHTGTGKKVGPYRVPVVVLVSKLKQAWGV